MARYDATTADFSEMASSGDAEVLYELGLMYATGRNGETDHIAAHKWLNIAAYRGFEPAKVLREEIASEMSRAEVAKAQREAREWIICH